MTTVDDIESHLKTLPEPKQGEMRHLHMLFSAMSPGGRLWFSDGRNSEGKIVANPTIGYGAYTIRYVDGSLRESFQVGLSANKTGISVYVLGLEDKLFLAHTFGDTIGKADVTGYCIRFKSIRDIDLAVLQGAVQAGFDAHPPSASE